ncbi:MAG: hypothetical protein ABR887_07435 [Methanoregulaceae archaeon]
MAIEDEDQIKLIIQSKRDEIVGKLNDRISQEVFKEIEVIQNKHDLLARDELARPFTI